MTRRRRGYILVETITAMAILSVTAVTVQRAIQVAIHARALAQDYSTAQLLLENTVAERSLQPRIALGDRDEGTFPPPHERFHYAWQLDEATVALPPLPPDLSQERRALLEQNYLSYLGRLRVEISWSRAGQPVAVAGELLLPPEQAWRPPAQTEP